ncbi:MAG: hypothetical protein JKY62_17055 [Desulfocapsa sp.]|nr:hypothetical protein [Desulfocapsa sp.]
MRNIVATTLIVIGIILAVGAEAPELSLVHVMIQGIGGTIIAGIGVIIYKEEES